MANLSRTPRRATSEQFVIQAFADWKSDRLAWKQRWPDSPGRWIFVNKERYGKSYSVCPYDRILKAIFPRVSDFISAVESNSIPQAHVIDALAKAGQQ